MSTLRAARALLALFPPFVLPLVAARPASQVVANTAEASTRFAPIAQLVDEAVARHELPGAVVFVGRGDAVMYQHAFGRRSVVGSQEAMTEDTIFDLASLTKVVATT